MTMPQTSKQLQCDTTLFRDDDMTLLPNVVCCIICDNKDSNEDNDDDDDDDNMWFINDSQNVTNEWRRTD